MKRIPLLLLLAALAVSLWFNFRPRPASVASSAPATPDGPVVLAPAAKPSPVLPAKLEEIDFSGTGLADESWKLDPAAKDQNIPDQVPDSNASNVPAPLSPPPTAWDLDGTIQLETTPKP
jgi:hypothetical protein